jgi:hypothetical protein
MKGFVGLLNQLHQSGCSIMTLVIPILKTKTSEKFPTIPSGLHLGKKVRIGIRQMKGFFGLLTKLNCTRGDVSNGALAIPN